MKVRSGDEVLHEHIESRLVNGALRFEMRSLLQVGGVFKTIVNRVNSAQCFMLLVGEIIDISGKFKSCMRI